MAKKEKQLWEVAAIELQRSLKRGGPRIYTAETMAKKAIEYFKFVDSNPFTELKPMVVNLGAGAGSEVEKVELPLKIPYTWEGLCLYMGVAGGYFRQFKSGQKEFDKDTSTVVSFIEHTIKTQQLNGASAGIFNSSIISQYLGLVTKTHNQNDNINWNSVEMTKDEVKDISKQLDEEI